MNAENIKVNQLNKLSVKEMEEVANHLAKKNQCLVGSNGHLKIEVIK